MLESSREASARRMYMYISAFIISIEKAKTLICFRVFCTFFPEYRVYILCVFIFFFFFFSSQMTQDSVRVTVVCVRARALLLGRGTRPRTSSLERHEIRRYGLAIRHAAHGGSQFLHPVVGQLARRRSEFIHVS